MRIFDDLESDTNLCFQHQHNLIHRDIKAENVFFADACTVKVGDFGFSTQITSREELLSTFCGSPPYAAPELFRDESYRGPFVDYWSLGVLLYFIVTASMPFRAQTIVALKKLILECRYDIPTYVSVECCQLIAGFLQNDPSKRYNLEHARATRWLRSAKPVSSIPKFDLKSSFSNLLEYRKQMKEDRQKYSATITRPPRFSLGDKPNDAKFNRHSLDLDHRLNGKPHLTSNETNTVISNQLSREELLRKPRVTRLTELERETFRRMMLLGIEEPIINEHFDKGSHSHIVGIFRILLLRVVREFKERAAISNDSGITTKSADEQKRRNTLYSGPLERFWVQHNSRNADRAISPKADTPVKSKPTDSESNHSRQSTANGSIDSQKSKRSKLSKIFQHSMDRPESSLASAEKELMKSVDRKCGPTEEKPIEVTKVTITAAAPKPAEDKTPAAAAAAAIDSNGNKHLFTKSLRTLRHLMTENSICGTNPSVAEKAIQRRTEGPGSPGDPTGKHHVVHKTTTMQIVPKQSVDTLFQNNNKLRRSHTTPNVSTCYYRQAKSDKKSFVSNHSRCAIV